MRAASNKSVNQTPKSCAFLFPLLCFAAGYFQRWAYKKMREIALFIFAFVVMPVIAFSETVECTDRPECWPETSSMHRGLLLVEQQKKLDILMVKKHDNLVKVVSETSSSDGQFHTEERLITALKTQQSSWLKYRPYECELVGSLSGAGGTWPSTFANQCEVNLTEQRIRKIRYALRCIQRMPQEKRWLEQNTCLYQLAPLLIK